MTKDVKFSCNFHVFFFLFKTHADTPLIEFKKPRALFRKTKKLITLLRFNEKSPFLH